MTPLRFVHFGLAVVCLGLGPTIFLRRKGTKSHRRIGIAYLAGMILVNASALMVYEDSVGFGPFHRLAILSLATVTAGVIPLVLKQPKGAWLDLHAYFFCWSYSGLLAAGVSQLLTKVESLPRPFQVLVPSILVMGIGAILIHTRVPRVLRQWREEAAASQPASHVESENT